MEFRSKAVALLALVLAAPAGPAGVSGSRPQDTRRAGSSLPALAGTAQPGLSHSAPFLGHGLTLRVHGAAPLQTVSLFASPAAGERVLPYGTLELDSDSTYLLVRGTTDPDGVFEFRLDLPADAARAEDQLHLQALVGEPSAPGSLALSEARHLRLLGPRIYVGSSGYASGGTTTLAGVTVVSAVHDAVVATVDFGAPRPEGVALGDGEPVFSSDASRGAVMASPFELVLFDPFFGGILRSRTFEEASRTLQIDASGERLFVLETGLAGAHASLHVLDFATGDTLDVIDLPRRAPGLWVAAPDPAASTVYIGELDGGRTHVRRFDLDQLQSRGSVAVGSDRSHLFTDMAFAQGQLFVGTQTRLYPSGYVRADFSRIDYGSDPPAIDVHVSALQTNLGHITPVPAAGHLLWATFDSTSPAAGLAAARLASPSPPVDVRMPYPDSGVRALAARDTSTWALVFSRDQDEPERLYRLDGITPSRWTLVSHLPCYAGGVDLAPLRDGFVDKLALTVTCGAYGPAQDPFLVVHDIASGTATTIPGALLPESLRVVTVP